MVTEKYIAERIRQLRKNASMSVDEVGKRVGRSGKTVSAWETGRNVPSADMLIDICRLFGVSINYFYPPDVSQTPSDTLTADERELLDAYRALGADARQMALRAVVGMASVARQSKNRKGGLAG